MWTEKDVFAAGLGRQMQSWMPQAPSEAAAAPVDLLAEGGLTRQVLELGVVGVAVWRGLLLPTLVRGWQLAKGQVREAISTPDLRWEVEPLLFWPYLAVGAVACQPAAGPDMAPPTSKAGAQASVK